MFLAAGRGGGSAAGAAARITLVNDDCDCDLSVAISTQASQVRHVSQTYIRIIVPIKLKRRRKNVRKGRTIINSSVPDATARCTRAVSATHFILSTLQVHTVCSGRC